MSKLVAWNYNEYKHVFKSKEQMWNTLGVTRKTLSQWVIKDLIGIDQKRYLDRLLISYDEKIMVNSKVGQQYSVNPRHKKEQSERMEYKLKNDRKVLSKKIKEGATRDSIAEFLGVGKTSVYRILIRLFGISSIPDIKNSLTINK